MCTLPAVGELVVIATGSRDWSDRDAIGRRLDQLDRVALLVTAGRPGAEDAALAWAIDRGVRHHRVRAATDAARDHEVVAAALMVREARPDVVVEVLAWVTVPGVTPLVAVARAAGIPGRVIRPHHPTASVRPERRRR